MRRALLLGLFALAACDGTPERAPGQYPITLAELELGAPADGPAEATYRRACLHCHGVDGRGAGGVTGADFTAATGPLTRGDEELFVSVRDGMRGSIGVMPAHRDLLSDEEIRGVLAYVRGRYGAGIAVVDAASPEQVVPEPAVPEPAVPEPAVPE